MPVKNTNNSRKEFEALISSDSLSHGYIFFGDIVSAKGFAHSLVCRFEHGDWNLDTESFSDLHILDGSKEKLGVEQARLCNKFLSLSPLNSLRRTLIIQEANKLTPAAQNAILKIAEEPHSKALIILILKDPSALLATLRSRFQELFFAQENQLSSSSELEIELEQQAKKFLLAKNNKARSEILKALVKDEKPFDFFVRSLMQELAKDKLKNAPALKELSKRWAYMNQFSVNKRLQIESILEFLS